MVSIPIVSFSVGDPMDLSAFWGPLTAEEKDRRRKKKLCLYCGKHGHMAMACPVIPAKTRKTFRPMQAHAATAFLISFSRQLTENASFSGIVTLEDVLLNQSLSQQSW